MRFNEKKGQSEKPVRSLKVIVLAAGKGKRLQSENAELPKVLRRAAGKPLLKWVADNLDFVRKQDIVLVVGYQAEKVKAEMGPEYQYAIQGQQLGTGHAAAAAAGKLAAYQGDILIIYGDMPLFKAETYDQLVKKHQQSDADCTMLTAIVKRDLAYGRIVRDVNGHFEGIVEQKDCNPDQLAIREMNPGVYVFKSHLLWPMLNNLKNNNAQGEYYLTDIPALLIEQGHVVHTLTIEDEDQILGVNTQEDLAYCSRLLQEREND